MDHKEIQQKVSETFKSSFGNTPLQMRLNDIMGEALELCRYTNMGNLREEFGDLLATVIAGISENQWDMADLLEENREKILRRSAQYHSLGRKIKVAILGGAFDPITQGHIALAKFVLDTSRTFDEVWLMPCYQHMYNKKMVSTDHRLNMCKEACTQDGRIKVCDFEIKNELRGETYNLVNRLLDTDFAKHEYDFSMIIGQDNANSFHRWINYEHLERLIRFVVVPRKGISPDPGVDWYSKPPHIYLHGETTIPEISSTEIRKELDVFWRDGTVTETVGKQLHPKVLEYIKNYGLYTMA
jgi:nicotinate-nucleotide adenylyltransferase